MREVYGTAVAMIGQKRAALATLLPIGTEHEMIDNELAAAGKKIGECFLSFRSIKHIVLLDFDPR